MTRLIALAPALWSPAFIGGVLFFSGLTLGVLMARPY